MIVFGICDDDTAFAQILTKNIRKITMGTADAVECIPRTFFSPHQVLNFIESSPIHILMLDIDMPGMNGFELANKLQRISPNTVIIFVSAYDSYVYDSFQYTPFAFLRKSHLKQELSNVVQKALDKILESDQTIVFSTTDGDINLPVIDIMYIESVKNYYDIYCRDDRRYRCRGTLTSVENKLEGNNFSRIHTAFLVNIANIKSVNSNRQLVLIDGTPFTVSLRKWKDFQKAYTEFCRKRVLIT